MNETDDSQLEKDPVAFVQEVLQEKPYDKQIEILRAVPSSRRVSVRAASKLRGRMFRTSRYEIDEQSFALGFATNSPYNLQGFHSPNLLAVITEAHAVKQGDMDAIRRLNPTRLLMTGNPFVNQGVFYDSHHSRREMYETIQIGASDTPNLKLDSLVKSLCRSN